MLGLITKMDFAAKDATDFDPETVSKSDPVAQVCTVVQVVYIIYIVYSISFY